MHEQLVQVRQQLHKLLFDDVSQTAHLLTSVEAATGIAREHFVYTLVGTVTLYLIAGEHAQLLCNVICFVIPTIIAYYTARAGDTSKFSQLNVYWTVYAVFGSVDMAVVACSQHFFPFYWLIKTIALLLLLLFPDGAQRTYDYFRASTIEAKESETVVVEQRPPIAGDFRLAEPVEHELTNTTEAVQQNESPPLPVSVEQEDEGQAPIVEEEPLPTPPEGDLRMEPNGTLVFNAPFFEQTLVYPVRITNTCQHPIGFAIKSNALPRLAPNRGFGVLAPEESVQFAVSCAPFLYHLEDTSKDRITIEYMGVPAGVHNFGLDWFVHKKGDCIIKRKNLFVQYNA